MDYLCTKVIKNFLYFGFLFFLFVFGFGI